MNITSQELDTILNTELEVDQVTRPNFVKWRGDKTLFVETGTNFGNGIHTALDCGFERAISVEISTRLFFENQFKYAKHDNVKLFLGDSQYVFPTMLSMVDEPAFFWIDAHHGNGDPAFHELKFLKNHHITTHTILVDDMTCHFHGSLRDDIEKLIMEINPNYTIEYMDNSNNVGMDYVLVAHV